MGPDSPKRDHDNRPPLRFRERSGPGGESAGAQVRGSPGTTRDRADASARGGLLESLDER